MHLTLGEDAALTTETVTSILERVSNEIKGEVSERLREEQQAHQETGTNSTLRKTAIRELLATFTGCVVVEQVSWLGFFQQS